MAARIIQLIFEGHARMTGAVAGLRQLGKESAALVASVENDARRIKSATGSIIAGARSVGSGVGAAAGGVSAVVGGAQEGYSFIKNMVDYLAERGNPAALEFSDTLFEAERRVDGIADRFGTRVVPSLDRIVGLFLNSGLLTATEVWADLLANRIVRELQAAEDLLRGLLELLGLAQAGAASGSGSPSGTATGSGIGAVSAAQLRQYLEGFRSEQDFSVFAALGKQVEEHLQRAVDGKQISKRSFEQYVANVRLYLAQAITEINQYGRASEATLTAIDTVAGATGAAIREQLGAYADVVAQQGRVTTEETRLKLLQQQSAEIQKQAALLARSHAAEMQALRDQQSALARQSEDALRPLDAALKTLRQQRTAAQRGIEAQIAALEQERDARLDPLDQLITALRRGAEDRLRPLDAALKTLRQELQQTLRPIDAAIAGIERQRDARLDPLDALIGGLRREAEDILRGLDAGLRGLRDEYDRTLAPITEALEALADRREGALAPIRDALIALEERTTAQLDPIEAEIKRLTERQRALTDPYDRQLRANDLRSAELELKLLNTRGRRARAQIERQLRGISAENQQLSLQRKLVEDRYQPELDALQSRKNLIVEAARAEETALQRRQTILERQFGAEERVLRERQETVQDEYRARIDAAERERTTVAENYRDRIDAAERERSAVAESAALQLDALRQQREEIVATADLREEAIQAERDALAESYRTRTEAAEREREDAAAVYATRLAGLRDEREAILQSYELREEALREERARVQETFDLQQRALTDYITRVEVRHRAERAASEAALAAIESQTDAQRRLTESERDTLTALRQRYEQLLDVHRIIGDTRTAVEGVNQSTGSLDPTPINTQKSAWERLKETIGGVFDALEREKTKHLAPGGTIGQGFSDLGTTVRRWVDDHLAPGGTIGRGFDTIGTGARSALDTVARTISTYNLFTAAQQMMDRLLEGLRTKYNQFYEFFWGRDGGGGLLQVVEYFTRINLFDFGRNLIQSLINGINDRRHDLVQLLAWLRGLFPASPAKHGPLRQPVRWAWLTDGLDDLAPDAARASLRLAQGIADGLSAQRIAGLSSPLPGSGFSGRAGYTSGMAAGTGTGEVHVHLHGDLNTELDIRRMLYQIGQESRRQRRYG